MISILFALLALTAAQYEHCKTMRGMDRRGCEHRVTMRCLRRTLPMAPHDDYDRVGLGVVSRPRIPPCCGSLCGSSLGR